MPDVSKLFREEAEHAEQNKDATPKDSSSVTRPGRDRAKVLSVRLNAEEYERLVAQAKVAGVGPSTLARSCILRVLGDAGDDPEETWKASVNQRLSRLEAKLESAS